MDVGDELLYDNGYLATGGLSFPDLAKQALINNAAKKSDDDPDFSRKIRRGIQGLSKGLLQLGRLCPTQLGLSLVGLVQLGDGREHVRGQNEAVQAC